MSPPAMLVFDDGLSQESSDNEWQGFKVFPRENPNPNYNNFLVKKAVTRSEKSTDPIFSRSSEREDSFRMVLPPAMPPPRDSAVPLPMLMVPKKLSRREPMRKSHYKEDDFRCNTFCLSLLGFGKQKKDRSSSSSSSSTKRQDSMEKKTMIRSSSFTNSTVSIRGSLDWASTTKVLTKDNGRLCLDFPVEMMKCNTNRSGNGGRDVQEHVSYGFLFERETETLALRSVLKTKSTRSSRRDHQRSAETSPLRRVRFSTSSVSCPTSPRSCITPRLRKARDDFNTFLASQNS